MVAGAFDVFLQHAFSQLQLEPHWVDDIVCLSSSTAIVCQVSSDEHSLMRRDDNRIVARLEDEQPYEEAENRDEDARKESCPESRYLEAGYN